MPRSRFKRHRRPGRRRAFRDRKPIILVVCEGAKTEPQYINGFRLACKNPRVTIKFASEQGVPRTLVEIAKQHKIAAEEEARRERDDNLAYDSVWCVFDIDDHPNVPNARKMADDNGIKVAVSNPCFELWLVLHFRDNPGMQHRDRLKDILAEYVLGYDKQVDYATYSGGYQNAAKRASQMDSAAESADDAGRNPTTGVYRLTELIRSE